MSRARVLGLIALGVGVAAGGYLGWCQHRLAGTTLVSDDAWPRPWPYPDGWLLRAEPRLDAAFPAPPGHLKFHGELPRLRGLVGVGVVLAGAVAAGGLGLLVGLLCPCQRPTPNQALQQTAAQSRGRG